MRQSGVLGAILPETEKWGIDAIPALVAAEQALGWEPEPMLRLAAIVPKDAERLAALAQRLRLSNAEAAFLDRFARAPKPNGEVTDAAFDRELYRLGKDGVIASLKIDLAQARAQAGVDPKAMTKTGRLSALLARAEKFERPLFPLSGADVLAAGLAPGPKVGEALKQLEETWIGSNFSFDRAKLLARLDDLIRK